MLALAMGCLTGGSGAMAQSAGWDAVYAQTQTTSDSWTKLSTNETNGKTLGQGGSGSSTTSYYYIDRNLSFTNYSGSGIKIEGTVYLYVPYGFTLTCEGSSANGQTGAGAGIELSSGNTLYIIGGGTVIARGGNAANGGNGGNGSSAGVSTSSSWSGTGGTGGYGGGGAGAGIGTKGGNGGDGGAGGSGYTENLSSVPNHDGRAGSRGSDGSTAGPMGNLYVENGTTVNAYGGSKGSTGGNGGSAGSNLLWDGGENDSLAGGGGGGGGGFGGAASNIGTGGPGGGGGGGGAGGSTHYAWSDYYRVGAWGGNPGANGDATFNTNSGYGGSTEMTGTRQAYNDSSNYSDKGYEGGHDNRGSGGGSGDRGYASSAGSQNTGTKTYTITYNPVHTRVNGTNTDPVVINYTPSAATDIVLPRNTEGYQWVLSTYGKSCAPQGTTVSEFSTATKEYYGGNIATSTLRTIVLGHVYGDLVFQELPTQMNMENTGNNEQELAEYLTVAYPINVRLKDRTLYRDNHWNTLCLPFNMTSTQIATSPLKGATIYSMNTTVTGYYPSGQVNKAPYQQFDYGYPVLLFWFDNVDITASGTVLQAGKPYLVKWAEADVHTIDGNYVDNTEDDNNRHDLDFEGVTITQTTGGSWVGAGTTNGNVTFQGTLSQSATLYKNDKTRLVLGADDNLYYPSKNMNVGACRGYFIIPEAAVAANAPEIVMGFNDGETTSIKVVKGSEVKAQGADTYYNLNGQRLSAPQKGINIVNGKKVFVK